MRLRVAHSERGESTEREEKREAFPIYSQLPQSSTHNMKIRFHNSVTHYLHWSKFPFGTPKVRAKILMVQND